MKRIENEQSNDCSQRIPYSVFSTDVFLHNLLLSATSVIPVIVALSVIFSLLYFHLLLL